MEKIKEKLQKLKEVEFILKNEYVGIDSIIDRILESITPWYVTPKIITRPTVVSLWGLTGTGKTSVVNRIIKLLDLEKDSLYFNCATEADNSRDSIDSKIIEFFEDADGNINSKDSSDDDNCVALSSRRCIMIFDEFQNCRTLDEHGDEKDRSQTSAIWQILDSGVLESTSWSWEITRAINLIEEIRSLAILYPNIPIKELTFTVWGEELEKIDEGFREYLEYNSLYNFYGSNYPSDLTPTTEDGEEIEENSHKYPSLIPSSVIRTIVKRYNSLGKGEGWKQRAKLRASKTLGEASEILEEYIKELGKPKKVDCSNSLVFVIGNLDEAFGVTDEIDPDVSANILNAMTSNVTITDVKNSLRKRFRLEQISRLGNNVILYPSLKEDDFKKIIDIELSKITKEFLDLSGFEIEFDEGMKNLVYSEAIYPVQGVRPIHSSISTLITPKLSKILIEKPSEAKKAVVSVEDPNFEKPNTTLTVTYDTGEKITLHQELTLGALRDISQYSKIYLHAVHEAGHAVVYSVLTGKCPETIVAITANGGGYMWREIEDSASRREADTFKDIREDVMISYAGYLSEKHFFHEIDLSMGASSDIQNAWNSLAEAVYECGYGERLLTYRNYAAAFPGGLNCQNNFDEGTADAKVSELSRELEQATVDIIRAEEKFIQEVALYLGENRKMGKEKFKEILAKYHPELFSVKKDKDWYKNQLL